MSWPMDLMAIAKWALQSEDLRHRLLYADSAEELDTTPGIAYTLETGVVLAIFETAIAKGFKRYQTVDYECSYPGEAVGNPKRADLAFKETGPGKNWCYVEVKYYGSNGKGAIERDIQKLRAMDKLAQRWVLCYRVRANRPKVPKLSRLIEKHFSGDFSEMIFQSVPTIAHEGEEGECEIGLLRIKQSAKES